MTTHSALAVLLSFSCAIPSFPGSSSGGGLPGGDLAALQGSWEGVCKTWSAGHLLDESVVRGTFEPGGERILRHVYTGSMRGEERWGEETILLAPTGEGCRISWFDTFHTNGTFLVSKGERGADGLTVLGTYRMTPEQDPWGWRTEYDLGSLAEGRLTIRAFNIAPDGREEKAMELVYERPRPADGSKASSALEAARAFVAGLDALDLDAIAPVLAPEMTMFLPHGDAMELVVGRNDVIEEMRQRFEEWRNAGDTAPLGLDRTAKDFRVHPLGERRALVTWHIDRPEAPGRRTAIAEERDGAWMLVHLHASNVTALR